ncbi:MAG: hypothetical protein II117_00555 [Clostridia bacterium]|nr:hypothetical protein [Clostridia bacterium]
MKEHELLDAVGGIDGKLIEEADAAVKKKPGRRFQWIAAAAACLLVGAGIAVPMILNRTNGNEAEPLSAEAEPAGVTIPAVTLPETSGEVAYDMVGLVVYKGRIYTQAGDYFGEDAKPLEALVGEHLGTAKGNLNEWSSQDEYATEFASTVPGEVYAVNGYDEGFRICIRGEIAYDDQEPVVWIQFFDCLNGVTLHTGKNLFEDRLHLRENAGTVRYLSHFDWDNGTGGMQEANLDADVWNAFWDQVDQAEFHNLWDPDGTWSDPANDYTTVYDTPNQTHLYLTMRDGTTVELRLIEGGYVGYQPLGWYFVQIPEGAFNAVYDACGGTH